MSEKEEIERDREKGRYGENGESVRERWKRRERNVEREKGRLREKEEGERGRIGEREGESEIEEKG